MVIIVNETKTVTEIRSSDYKKTKIREFLLKQTKTITKIKQVTKNTAHHHPLFTLLQR